MCYGIFNGQAHLVRCRPKPRHEGGLFGDPSIQAEYIANHGVDPLCRGRRSHPVTAVAHEVDIDDLAPYYYERPCVKPLAFVTSEMCKFCVAAVWCDGYQREDERAERLRMLANSDVVPYEAKHHDHKEEDPEAKKRVEQAMEKLRNLSGFGRGSPGASAGGSIP